MLAVTTLYLRMKFQNVFLICQKITRIVSLILLKTLTFIRRHLCQSVYTFTTFAYNNFQVYFSTFMRGEQMKADNVGCFRRFAQQELIALRRSRIQLRNRIETTVHICDSIPSFPWSDSGFGTFVEFSNVEGENCCGTVPLDV